MILPMRIEPAEMEARKEAPVSMAETFDFVQVVDRFETPLLRYAGQVLGPDIAEAREDIVQETFLRLHQYVEKHGHCSIENLTSWLFRVAHNLAIDCRRRRDSEKKVLHGSKDGLPDASVSSEALEGLAGLVHKEACSRAMAELQRLPEPEKHVLLLKIVHGMTLREISEITGMSMGNVDYRIGQGLRVLARRLKEAGLV